jgi:hypothetical protein
MNARVCAHPRWLRRGAVRVAGVVVLGAIALVAAGCGGSESPSVASIGTTTSNGASSSASGSPGFPSSGGPLGSSMSMEVGTGAAGVEYTACMRSHGLPNYPDPDAQGVITITISTSLNPSSPLFQKAEADCQHLIPAGKAPSPAKQQQHRQRALAFAACMRSHGVPNYPDPTFGPGGMVSQKIDRRSVDPSSPIFHAAQKTCQSSLTGGGK